MGVKSKKRAKTRLDAYYRLAKSQGYRARSAFKLIQLNRKYDFLSKARCLVDLCAAPGGWLQVASKHMPVGSRIVGVDLAAIAPIRGCKTIVGDITDGKTKKEILQALQKDLADVVIHDGAPNVGGVWARDVFAQNALVLAACRLATEILRPGGFFLTKVFRGQDFQKLIWVLKQFFEKVEATKPLASRMESAEIFVVCGAFKAPKQIDAKLFSAQHVFSDVGPERILNEQGMLAVPKSRVPEGYDDFTGPILHRTATMSQFLECEDPKAFLKKYHEITFPPEDQEHLKSKWTKKELVFQTQDLRQVGEADRRRLIRWREQLLREAAARRLAETPVQPQQVVAETAEDAPVEDEAEQIALELLKYRKAQAKEAKRIEKKRVNRKLKQIKGLIGYDPTESARHPTEMHGDAESENDEDAKLGEEENEEEWTFEKLASVPEERMARLFDKHYEEPVDLRGMNVPVDSANDVNPDQEEIDVGADGVAEGERDDALLEGDVQNDDELDVDNYGNYIPSARAEGVERFDIPGNQPNAEKIQNVGEEDKAAAKAKLKRQKEEEELEAIGKQAKWQRRHRNIEQVLNRTFQKFREPKGRKRQREEEELLVPLSAPDNASGNDAEAASTTSSSDTENEAAPYDVTRRGRTADGRRRESIVPDIGKLNAAELAKAQRKKLKGANKEARKKKNDTAFEEIPLAMADPDTRARTLAIATKMLDPNARRDIVEASINRFMHNDDENLPEWFLKDEARNCKVVLPVTAAEIDAQRQRFRELNSRPSRQVMEAVGRKRRKAQRMLRGMLEKAKTDPQVRDKTRGLSVRKLMRSKGVRGKPEKRGPLDKKLRGEKKRGRQQMKKKLGKKHR